MMMTSTHIAAVTRLVANETIAGSVLSLVNILRSSFFAHLISKPPRI